MATVFVRLLLIYFFTVFSMRLMGKRQIGQMQMGELVCAFFLSELAAYPITNQSVPLSYGVISVVTLICLEVLLSFLSTKCARLRRVLDAPPNALICRGRLQQKELARARLSAEELLSLLRLKDAARLEEVDYALLEANGEISVIKKKDGGLQHLLVADGKLHRRGIHGAGLCEDEVHRMLAERGLEAKDVFLFCIDDLSRDTLLTKERQ